MIGRKLSWAVFGSALEWVGALATLALVYFQVNFVSVSEDYALEAQLMAIEEKIDVSCRAITSELLDMRDAALDRDSLTVYLSRRKAAEACHPSVFLFL